MGHLADITNHYVAVDILTHNKAELALVFGKFGAFNHFTDCYDVLDSVRHFDTYSRLAGDWCFDTYTCCCKIKCDIVGKACNLGDFHACTWL